MEVLPRKGIATVKITGCCIETMETLVEEIGARRPILVDSGNKQSDRGGFHRFLTIYVEPGVTKSE